MGASQNEGYLLGVTGTRTIVLWFVYLSSLAVGSYKDLKLQCYLGSIHRDNLEIN